MAKILQSAPIHRQSRFTYSGGVFSAFASDFGRANFTGQLYDDACDEGFGIMSEKTGKVVYFSLDHIERDSDGIKSWTFAAVVPESSEHRHLRVVVFNT